MNKKIVRKRLKKNIKKLPYNFNYMDLCAVKLFSKEIISKNI